MKLLFTFLLFSSIVFAQEKGKARMMIYPGCEKFEKKGVKKLADCFSKDFNKQLLLEVEQVLKNNGLTINEINVNAKVKFQINKEGEFQDLEVIGNDSEKLLIEEAFVNYVVKLKKDNKKIIPKKKKKGEAARLIFDIPFKIIN